MKKVAVLIPVYKDVLDSLEQYSVARSLKVLAERDIFFVGPEGLDCEKFSRGSRAIPFIGFEPHFFRSVEGYSQLLLSTGFYERFNDYDFLLVAQTDAIVLRDDLNFWCNQLYDYIGAPWPEGYELFLNMGPFKGVHGRKIKVHVGNGGLSLRRVRKCISLLNEFEDVVTVFNRTGSSEDLFFSVMGAFSDDFIIPNEIVASRFAMELRPSYYCAINGDHLPMGGHAWAKHEPEFWRKHLGDMPSLLTRTE